MSKSLEPIISLVHEKTEDGTYRAIMIVSGLQSEQQAQAALDHMCRLFCGDEMQVDDGEDSP